METKELKCADKVETELESRIKDLRSLWRGYCNGNEEKTEEFYNYGLSFDYVAPNTFQDQEEGYFRYQISWGGPSDEFRFYCSPGFKVRRIEYWFLDWFDGASIDLSGRDYTLMEDIFSNFNDCGTTEHEFNKAMEE